MTKAERKACMTNKKDRKEHRVKGQNGGEDVSINGSEEN